MREQDTNQQTETLILYPIPILYTIVTQLTTFFVTETFVGTPFSKVLHQHVSSTPRCLTVLLHLLQLLQLLSHHLLGSA